MDNEDIKPTPQALFVNENFHEDVNDLQRESYTNICIQPDLLLNESGRLTPQDKWIFAQDYVVNENVKHRKIDYNTVGENTFNENIEVKVERDDVDGDCDHHNVLESYLNSSEEQKAETCHQHNEESRIKVEAETDEDALLRYYLSTMPPNQSTGESSILQSNSSSTSTTSAALESETLESSFQIGRKTFNVRPHMTREQRAAARNAIKERLEAAAAAATAKADREQAVSQASSKSNEGLPATCTDVTQEENINEHSQAEHMRCVETLCRLCGEKLQHAKMKYKYNHKFLCKRYATEILAYFRVDTSCDSQYHHSPFFCKKCHTRIKMIIFRKLDDSSSTLEVARKIGEFSNDLWRVENQTLLNCSICNHYKYIKKGALRYEMRRLRGKRHTYRMPFFKSLSSHAKLFPVSTSRSSSQKLSLSPSSFTRSLSHVTSLPSHSTSLLSDITSSPSHVTSLPSNSTLFQSQKAPLPLDTTPLLSHAAPSLSHDVAQLQLYAAP